MPLNAAPPPGPHASMVRTTTLRLVIFERLVLFGPGAQADSPAAPPADPTTEAIDATARLAHGGFQLAIVSQHPGLARGVLEMTTVNLQNRRLSRHLEEGGGRIDAIAICPHGPDAGCGCRMPRPGLLTDLMARFSVVAPCTTMIAGTREAAEAGQAADCLTLWIGGNGGTGAGGPGAPDTADLAPGAHGHGGAVAAPDRAVADPVRDAPLRAFRSLEIAIDHLLATLQGPCPDGPGRGATGADA